jgi:DNA mismatch repair protein MutS
LAEIPDVRALLGERQSLVLRALAERLGDFTSDVEEVRETLVDAPPLGLKEGGLIRDGFSGELDRLRGLARGAKDWIAQFQSTERERTGIPNLKIGYNRVFGYYIEVSRGQKARVPESYERRQTLTGAERFITPELKEREAEILGAQDRSWALELELFEELRNRLAMRVAEMRRAAHALAKLDVLCSFADVARRGNWTRPVVDDSGRIDIRGGRHPVVEAALPAQEFVPNDTHLDLDTPQILLITGPNMAGKSTFLRQVALLCILAQTGSYLPAEEARIGVVDRVFTRVGAADQVARGHSTFMVEMVEVSRILSAATRQSLVLLDEVGRGTSTYDGLAIAWAVLEHLHDNPERAARTLFATHYHELTGLAERLERACNLRVTVHEWKDDVVFLRKIVEGAADRSFGIHVARLAGLPEAVTKRAKQILGDLESGRFQADGSGPKGAQGSQLDLFSKESASILSELALIEPETMTPMEAIAVLHDWKNRTRMESS